jgi:PHYB activation tagged suppressor 1
LPTKKNWQSWKLDREIRRSLTRLIARRSDEAEAEEEEMGSHSGGFRDLLGAMINAGERKTPPAGAIPVADMLEECKTFFFAGKQTTTNLLAWATVLLAMHPEWQERARREVLDVLGPDELPSKEHLPRLKTVSEPHCHITACSNFPNLLPWAFPSSFQFQPPLTRRVCSPRGWQVGMIINETLRLYPPAVATIRRAKTDVQLSNGCLIPRDTELLIPIMAIHHDARLWGADAAQFNPARFAGGAARAAKHPLAFIPFGLGARACIGQNLARLEAQLTVAVLLQRFEIRASPNYVHAPTVLMLLYPQYGAPVIFRPRRPARPAAAS